jgi:hypothetical protein
MKKNERKEINKTLKKQERVRKKNFFFLKKTFFSAFFFGKKGKKVAQKQNQTRDILLKNFWSK